MPLSPEFDVAGDPALRATLRTAKAWGVPLSIFLGRQRITTYEYGVNGRIARTVEDPLWLESDIEAAFALEAYEADLCSGCGISMTESTKIENDEKYVVDHIRCHACTALDIWQGMLQKKPHASAILTSVRYDASTPEIDDETDLQT